MMAGGGASSNRSSSSPSSLGMWRSKMSTSKCDLWRRSRATDPSAASCTTFWPELTSSAMLWRRATSSSATRMSHVSRSVAFVATASPPHRTSARNGRVDDPLPLLHPPRRQRIEGDHCSSMRGADRARGRVGTLLFGSSRSDLPGPEIGHPVRASPHAWPATVPKRLHFRARGPARARQGAASRSGGRRGRR